LFLENQADLSKIQVTSGSFDPNKTGIKAQKARNCNFFRAFQDQTDFAR
jgi:hypothetical protein